MYEAWRGNEVESMPLPSHSATALDWGMEAREWGSAAACGMDAVLANPQITQIIRTVIHGIPLCFVLPQRQAKVTIKPMAAANAHGGTAENRAVTEVPNDIPQI